MQTDMIGQKRHVMHNGYVKLITVLSKSDVKIHGNDSWFVQQDLCTDPKHPHRVTSQRFWNIHEDHFFHKAIDGLVLREAPDFFRKWNRHPIEIVDLPAVGY